MSKKTEVVDESAAVFSADVRVSVSEEIKRTRDLISDDTQPDEEAILRARLSGLEWALADTLRLMTLHQMSG